MTRDAVGSRTAILYSRPGCPLCFVLARAASRAARRHGLGLRVVDIRSDPDLLARYDREVPVLELPGGGTIRGRAGAEEIEAAFRRAVEAGTPIASPPGARPGWLRRIFGSAGPGPGNRS